MESTESFEFSRQFRYWRTKAGLSQLAAAQRLFTTQATISRWESGADEPSAGRIAEIAQALGITGAEFMMEEDEAAAWRAHKASVVRAAEILLRSGSFPATVSESESEPEGKNNVNGPYRPISAILALASEWPTAKLGASRVTQNSRVPDHAVV